MSLFTCCLWWFVLGALVGWLLSWLFNRLFGRTEAHETTDAAPAAAPPVPLPAAARVDDLVIIEGIGPKIAELLRRNGIDSFDKLARADVASLWAILDKGGPRFKLANPGTWPTQALYCVRGDWDGLKRWQDELYGGVALLADVPADVVIDVAAAKAAGFDMKGPDDLEVVEGIGPEDRPAAPPARHHDVRAARVRRPLRDRGDPREGRAELPRRQPRHVARAGGLLRPQRLGGPQAAPGPAHCRPRVRGRPCASSTAGLPSSGGTTTAAT